MPGRLILTFAVLLIAWVAFTGSIVQEELIAGAIVSICVSIIAYKDLIKGSTLKKLNPVRWLYFLAFLLYVDAREVIAHLKVIAIILSPWLKIKPEIVKIKTSLKNQAGITALANSITLTPGTLTVNAENSELEIHCITTTPKEDIFGKSEKLLEEVVK